MNHHRTTHHHHALTRLALSIALLLSALTPTLATPKPAQASVVYSPFVTRYRTEDFGDIAFVANTLMTCSTATGATGASSCPAARTLGAGVSYTNNSYRMVFTDVDSDITTDNSSTATLSLPPGSTVLFAGLYWGGYGGDNSNPTNKAPRSVVKFGLPGASAYTTITASRVVSAGTGLNAYQAFADVTSLIPPSGNGTYTLANAQLVNGNSGTYGGWNMIVVYRDPNGLLKDLSVYDGLAYVDSGGPIDTPISGFLTPPAGIVQADVGVVAYDGDRGFNDTGVSFNGSGLTNALNPSTDGYNSTISTDGVNVTSRSQPFSNTFGYDADLLNADGVLANNQTSTTIRVATNSEVIYLGAVTAAIKVFKPVITKADKSQSVPIDGVVQPGDLISYSIRIDNVGTTNTLKTVISDAVPLGTSYVPGSMAITDGDRSPANAPGPLTDAVGDDRGSLVGSTVVFNVGDTSSASQGGVLGFRALNGISNTSTISNWVQVSYTVRVNDGLTAAQPITNMAQYQYSPFANGAVVYTGPSDLVTATVASANLSIAKTATPNPAIAGRLLTYTLIAANAGPQTANIVTVTDALPAGLTFVSCASDGGGVCAGSGLNRSVTYASLAPNATRTITLVATLAEGAAGGSNLVNTAVITARTPDPATANNSATITTPVQSIADLGILKTASAAQVILNQPLTFTLVVSNSGPSVASKVVITDVLPANLAYVACSSTGGGVCAGSGQVRTVSFATLGVGQTATVTLVARAIADGAISNSATIASASIDPAAANNTSVAASDVLVPRIGLAKSAGAPVNNFDGTYDVTYTLKLANAGETALNNAQITETLSAVFAAPASFAVLGPVTASGATPNAGFTGSAPNDQLLSGADTLAIGASALVTFTTRITPRANLGPYDNSVVASAIDPAGGAWGDVSQDGANPDPDADGNPNNNSAVTPVTFAEAPQLATSKAVSNVVNNGDGSYDVTYAVTLQNSGDVVLQNIQATDNLRATYPAPISYTIIAAPSGAGVASNTVFNGDSNTALLIGTDALPIGQSRTISFTVRIAPGANLGPYVNVANGAATSPAGAPLSTPSGSASVTFVEAPAIGASKLAGTPVNNGDGSYTVVYTAFVKNIGNIVLTNVQMRDDLNATFASPATFSIVSAPSGGPFAVNPAFDGNADTTLLAAGGVLAPGQMATVTFAVRVFPNANLGPYNNSIVASGTSPANTSVQDLSDDASPPDPDNDGDASEPGENDATSITFQANPELGIAKALAGVMNLNDGTYIATFDIVVENSGDVPLNSVQARDVLTEAFAAPVAIISTSISSISSASPNAAFDGITDTRLFKPGSSLAVGERVTITIDVRVRPGTALGPHQNAATVSAISTVGNATIGDNSTRGTNPDPDGDGDPTNDSAPTPVTFAESPQIGLAKRVTGLIDNHDGTYTVFYELRVANAGDVPLVNVQITENLSDTFKNTLAWQLTTPLTGTGVTINPAFNGGGNTLLLSGSDALAYGASATVQFGVLFTPGPAAAIDNSARADASGPGGTPTSDVSNNGSDPNPAGSAPTPLSYPRVSLAKSVGNLTHLGGGVFEVTYVLTLTNSGTEKLADISIKDDMDATFSGIGWGTTSITAAPFVANAGFGPGNAALLEPGQSLGVGESVVMVITVKIDPAGQTGPFVNSAEASGTGGDSGVIDSDTSHDGASGDPDADGNADEHNTPTPLTLVYADVSIVKSAPPALVPGTNAVYTLTLSNAGPSTALDIVISDPTPPGMTLVGVSAPCASGFPCAVSDLAANSSIEIYATYALPANYTAASSIANSASITSTTQDPDLNNDVTSTNTPVTPRADLAIAKLAPAAITPGTSTVFTITLQNNGPSDAQGVVISDTAPAGLTWVSNSGACASGFPCAVGTLAASAQIVVVATYAVPSGYALPDPIINTAEATAATLDPTPANNTAIASGPLAFSADLTIDKVGPPNAVPGQTVVYTITVANNGPSDAQNVSVADFGPPDTTFIANSGDCATAFPCALGTITVGQTRVIISTYRVPQDYVAATNGAGPLVNTARVSSDTPDSVGPNEATATVPLVQSADLQISKTGAPSATAGTTVAFTVTVINAGPSMALGAVISDATPAGLTFVSASGPCASGYPCELPQLAAGEILTLVNEYAVPAGYQTPDPIANSASITSTTPDPTPDNTASALVPLATSANLTITKTGAAAAVPGAQTQFTITVVNNGPSVARDVTVSDPTPAGLTFSGASAPCATGFPCALGDMTVGQTVNIVLTYSVPAAYTAPDPIANTATVSSTTPDPAGPNAADAQTPLMPLADLVIAKTGAGNATAGTQTQFTVTVRNDGPSVARAVTVTDPTPAGLVFGANSGDCTNAYPCALGDLAVGQVVTIVSSYDVPSGYLTPATITNTASVTSNTPDPSGPNSGSATTPLTTTADLVIAKLGAASATPGSNTTFTITVRNDGPSIARDVTISDPTPAGLSFVGNSGDCANAYPCAVGDLAVGQTITIVSAYAIPASYTSPDPIANSASVTSTTADPSGTNVVTATTPLAPSADLIIAKAGASAATPGTNTTFTVTVRNDGPSDARNVTISDPTPAGLSFVSNGGACASAYPCVIGDLVAGQTITIVSVYAVPSIYTSPNPITNTASVTSTTPDPAGPNSSAITTPLAPLADLQINKLGAGSATAGTQTQFTVTVYNAGPSVARAVTVTDPTPAGLAFVGNSGGCASAYPCAIGDLAVGQTITIVSAYAIPADYAPAAAITNTASVDSATPDPAGPNSVSAGASLTTTADLIIAKQADPFAVPGTRTTFTITVRNAGPSDAQNVVVADPLPSGLTWVANAGDCTAAFPCAIGTLAAGRSITIVSSYDVDAAYSVTYGAGQITNTATVASGTADPSWPNQAVATTPARALADLALDKRVTSAAVPVFGDLITYTLVLDNSGPSVASGVSISEALPSGLTFVGASASHGEYDDAAGLWTIGVIEVNARATLTLTARAARLGAITNIAQVASSAQADPDATAGNSVPGEDDQSSAVVTIGEAPDLLLGKTASVVSNGDATYNITYRLTLSNTGNVPASGLRITDALSSIFQAPTVFSVVVAPSADGGLTPNIAFDGAADIDLLSGANTLPVGGAATVSFTVRVRPALTDTFANSANASGVGPGGTPMRDASNDGAFPTSGDAPTRSTLPIADLQVVKTSNMPRPNLGDVFSYVVRINNAGPSTANAIVLTETLPSTHVYVAHETSHGSYDAATGLWTVGALSNDASAALTLTVRVAALSAMTNTVVASSTTPDPNPLNNRDDLSTPTQIADVKLSKRVTPLSAAIGQEITYTIAISNSGPDAATGVVVRDELPTGVAYVRSSASQGAYDPATSDWSVGRLEDRATATLRIVARVTAVSVLTNTAETINLDQFDPNATPGNHVAGEDDQAEAGLIGLGVPALALRKQSAVAGSVRDGDRITYTIAVENLGSGPSLNTVITDPVPASTVFVSADGGGQLENGRVIWRIGSLAPNATTTVTLVVAVSARGAAPNLVIRNAASAAGDGPGAAVLADSNETRNTLAPTAVSLTAFSARRDGADGRQAVIVEWRTALEMNTLGFEIWRGTDNRKSAVKLSATLIPARNTAGAAYAFVDADPVDGARYWLEEIEIGGARQTYGPVAIAVEIQQQSPSVLVIDGLPVRVINAERASAQTQQIAPVGISPVTRDERTLTAPVEPSAPQIVGGPALPGVVVAPAVPQAAAATQPDATPQTHTPQSAGPALAPVTVATSAAIAPAEVGAVVESPARAQPAQTQPVLGALPWLIGLAVLGLAGGAIAWIRRRPKSS